MEWYLAWFALFVGCIGIALFLLFTWRRRKLLLIPALDEAPEGYNAQSKDTYLTPAASIPCASGDMLFFVCRTYGIIKISQYWGF